jgi:hypothetical protein
VVEVKLLYKVPLEREQENLSTRKFTYTMEGAKNKQDLKRISPIGSSDLEHNIVWGW